MMAAVPVLMVIYTSDAVEVRYSDGSRLELSPCGSVVQHHDTYNHQAHPLAGSKFVQLRTRFATSDFWDKIVHAVDFRNRFAERPYVCQELLHEDEVVSLYADIEQSAWPRDSKKSNIEHLPDGGIRIFSVDEYASLVLSPHRQEFTVCYLSKLGQEVQRRHKQSSSHLSTSGSASSSLNNNECTLRQNCSNSGSLICNGSSASEKCVNNSPVASDRCRNVDKHSDNNSVQNNSSVTPEIFSDNCPIANNGCRNVEKGSVNISVETKIADKSEKCLHADSKESYGNAKPELCPDVNRSFTNDEKLRASPSGLVKPVCPTCRVSTPTDDLCERFDSDAQVTAYGKTSGFTPGNLDHLPDLSMISKTSSEGLCTTIDIDATLEIQNRTEQNVDDTAGWKEENQKTATRENVSTESAERNKSKNRHQVRFDRSSDEIVGDKNVPRVDDISPAERIEVGTSLRSMGDNSGSEVTEGDGSKCRHLYCWVTRHFSCNECPLSWRQPLKLATDAVASKTETEKEGSPCPDVVTVFKPSQPRKIPIHIDKKSCMLTSLPRPLPLTCPFQHKHKWNVSDDSEIIQAGILKVILIDGAVYRIIRMASMNVIEVYPGDGSVFISEGISGHYFSYIRYADQQISEKTFSLKALPPCLPGAAYSIEKLLKRANRFLTQATQCDKMASAVDPCWKKEEVKIVEPLPVATLEECQIPGWGRFTAYTNGRVRVVFEDRTSMDLVCDFSRRIAQCVCHSTQSEELVQKCESAKCRKSVPVTGLDAEFDRNTCRILLPSGKYILVDLHKPGIYHKYVSQAMEWGSWVNSSPLERQRFYDQLRQPESVRMSAEAELKKIMCFNYIVDNTGLKRDPTYQTVNTSPTGQPVSSQRSQVTASGHQHFSPPSQITTSGQQHFGLPSQVTASGQQHFSPPSQVTASGQQHFSPPSQVTASGQQHFSGPSQVTASGQQHFSPPSQVTASGQQHFSPPRQVTASGQPSEVTVSGQQHFGRASEMIGSREFQAGTGVGDKGSLRVGNRVAVVEGGVTQREASPQLSGNGQTFEMLHGFNSVRQALLQTNRLIKDIDEILEKNNNNK